MTPTLFSISYAGFWGQSTLNLIDFIKHAGKLGYPSVMIAGKPSFAAVRLELDARLQSE